MPGMPRPPVSFFISAADFSLPLAMASWTPLRTRSSRNSASLRIDHGRIDLDGEHVAGAGGEHVHLAAADAGLDRLHGEFFLFGGKPGLHLLGLFHEFLDVHKFLVG